MLEMTRNTTPPITPTKITTRLFFDEPLVDGGSGRGEGERELEAESFRSVKAGSSTGGGVAGAGEGAEEDGGGLSGKLAARLKGL